MAEPNHHTYQSDLRKWLGPHMDENQRIRGAPGSDDGTWLKTTGGDSPIKLDTVDQHFAFDKHLKLNWLAGIYDESSGLVRSDVLTDIITAFRHWADYTSRADLTSIIQRAIAFVTGNSTASQATHTLTVPADTYYYLTGASAANMTRNPQFSVRFIKGAGTAREILTMPNVGSGAVYYTLIGGTASTATPEVQGVQGGWPLGPADDVIIEDNAFVAADDMDINWFYEVYT